MSQTLWIWDNYLVVFACLGIYNGICFGICHVVCIGNLSCWSFYYVKIWSPGPEGGSNEKSGRPWNLIHSLPCRTPCRLFIHEIFFRPLGPPPSCVKWTWTVSTILTYESSYIAMVTGLQSCVWSGPQHVKFEGKSSNLAQEERMIPTSLHQILYLVSITTWSYAIPYLFTSNVISTK